MKNWRVNWVILVMWTVVGALCVLFWFGVFNLIPNGTITAQGAGQPCDFNGDCGFSEYCHTVPFPQRGDNKSRGICVPNNTN